MLERVTISIDDSLVKKVRVKQSGLIKKDNSNWSFSKTVGYLLERGLK